MLRVRVFNLNSGALSGGFGFASLVFLAIVIAGALMIDIADAARVSLNWDARLDSNIAGYRLYYGTSSGAYDRATDMGRVTSYTLANLSEGMTYYFAVTAYDAFGEESEPCAEITYTVDSFNDPPVSDAGSEQSVSSAAIVVLNGKHSSDPEGMPLSYKWIQVEGPSVALMDADLDQPTFIAPDTGAEEDMVLVFRLTVTDVCGLQATDTCSVHVGWANVFAAAHTGSEENGGEVREVTVDGWLSKLPADEELNSCM